MTHSCGLLLLSALISPVAGWAGAGQTAAPESDPAGLRSVLKAQPAIEPASAPGLNAAQRRELRAQIRAQAADPAPNAKSKFFKHAPGEGRP